MAATTLKKHCTLKKTVLILNTEWPEPPEEEKIMLQLCNAVLKFF